MSEHTPGPWKAVFPQALDYRAPIIFTSDGKSRIADLAGGGPHLAIDAPTARANAVLMAASPVLLQVLEDAQRVIEKHGFGGTDQNPFGIRDLIGSAILQARRVP